MLDPITTPEEKWTARGLPHTDWVRINSQNKMERTFASRAAQMKTGRRTKSQNGRDKNVTNKISPLPVKEGWGTQQQSQNTENRTQHSSS